MRWRKLGLVFDLSKHRLPAGSVGFAQSPQPVVFDNFVRDYFSTRAVDPENGFAMKYQLIDKNEKHLDNIAKAVKKASGKPKAAAKHPKFINMIAEALKKLNEKSGSSRQAILKYIVATYALDAKVANQHLKVALKNGVKKGSLKQSKGLGASGSFKIGEGIKNAAKDAAKKAKVAAKKAAKKGKKAAKKAKKAKKAAYISIMASLKSLLKLC